VTRHLSLPDYDIVIATRNRQSALALSVPLMLKQDPPPKQLILVDASDDHEDMRRVVHDAAAGGTTSVTVVQSAPGLSVQRNVGLTYVTSPIVFCPDDDALWHQDFAHYVLEVYARDTESRVAGVGGREVFDMPGAASAPTYHRAQSTYLVQRLTPLRFAIESKYYPEPMVLLARERMGNAEVPAWVDGEDIVAVEQVTGFRSSFRSSFIKAVRFDQELTGSSNGEDVDISLAIWERHLLLVDHRARVMHYKKPGGRYEGWESGYFHVLSFVYVVAKHCPPGSPARRRMLPWALYRCALYLPRARDAGRRARLRGALASLSGVRELSKADTSQLAAIYRRRAARALLHRPRA
jgi:glycosyltransferase involved in cell wall biosynthesis